MLSHHCSWGGSDIHSLRQWGAGSCYSAEFTCDKDETATCPMDKDGMIAALELIRQDSGNPSRFVRLLRVHI